MTRCAYCGQEVEPMESMRSEIVWVETRSGDDGGYYDICPENPEDSMAGPHKPKKGA